MGTKTATDQSGLGRRQPTRGKRSGEVEVQTLPVLFQTAGALGGDRRCPRRPQKWTGGRS